MNRTISHIAEDIPAYSLAPLQYLVILIQNMVDDCLQWGTKIPQDVSASHSDETLFDDVIGLVMSSSE